jgi:hypothetical protein
MKVNVVKQEEQMPDKIRSLKKKKLSPARPSSIKDVKNGG